ncbi:MAG: hypothetical protein V8T10_00460 [Merdibacter sp.]
MPMIVVCSLADAADKLGIRIDEAQLSDMLALPVLLLSARKKGWRKRSGQRSAPMSAQAGSTSRCMILHRRRSRARWKLGCMSRMREGAMRRALCVHARGRGRQSS